MRRIRKGGTGRGREEEEGAREKENGMEANVLERCKRAAEAGSSTAAAAASREGPEAIRGGTGAPVVVHEEGASVGHEGRILVSLLAIQVMFPTRALLGVSALWLGHDGA